MKKFKSFDNKKSNLFKMDDLKNEELKIACNLNKCRYSELHNKTILNSIYPTQTHIFISLNTIIEDWIGMLHVHKIENPVANVSDVEIVAAILEVVAHYRKFYSSNKHVVKVYMYYSFSWFVDRGISFVRPVLKEPGAQDKLNSKLKSALNMINEIVKCIKGLYLVPTSSLNPGVFPYYMIGVLRDINVKKTEPDKFRILIVSKRYEDYMALAQFTAGMQFQMFIYRRRKGLYARDEVLPKLMFQGRRILNPKAIIFNSFFPALVLMRAKKLNIIFENPFDALTKKEFEDDVRKILMDKGFNTDFFEWSKKWVDFMVSEPTRCNLYDTIYIPYVYSRNIMRLNSDMKRWKVDMIDYGIETLNDSIFRNCKIDFMALF